MRREVVYGARVLEPSGAGESRPAPRPGIERTILVSNRLPVTVRRSESGATLVPSSGGLVAGLAPVHDAEDSLWVGNLGIRNGEDWFGDLCERRFVNVDIPPGAGKGYYDGFSNSVLWPGLHFLVDSIRFECSHYEAYEAVNERFAETIVKHASGRSAEGPAQIWIHDYHLMLLPRLIRKRMPDARIGFFLHTPFPPAEIFESIPRASELLRGLAAADLIGVHTRDYADHLLRAFRRELGGNGDARTNGVSARRVEVHPIGVDVESLRARAKSPAVERLLAQWRKRVGGRKVILGVDRLDYTKGIPSRLDAFRKLLETDEEWAERAVYIQIAVPSRTRLPAYRTLKEDVERRVGEINGRFSSKNRVPLWYRYRTVPPNELSALYRLADVLLVTPLRDGMNLVAKEYVASRLDRTGVLVLSQFAGAARELRQALLVNPWDAEGTAHTLRMALERDVGRQRQAMTAMQRTVEAGDALRWGHGFMRSLERTRTPQTPRPSRVAVTPGASIPWSPAIGPG